VLGVNAGDCMRDMKRDSVFTSLQMLTKTFVARYSFRCPLCWSLNTGTAELAALTKADAHQQFGSTALLCLACNRCLICPTQNMSVDLAETTRVAIAEMKNTQEWTVQIDYISSHAPAGKKHS
jgi:formate hydrogenlyase subunit 6/NADH:ubiquinone oxidoreductase subunit I